jgi:4-carboxymuconolactone decarboxylase
MMRIAELRPETMTEEQKAVQQEIVSGPHGRIVGPYFAWLYSPELARRTRNLSEFIRFKSTLPPRLSELAILITGRFWRADFEFYAHARLGKQAGLDEALITALAENRRPTFKLEGERVVYDLIWELLHTQRAREATYARAVQALGQQAVVELVATAGYYSMVSLTLNCFQVPLPEGVPSPFRDAKPGKAKSAKAARSAARPAAKRAASAKRKAAPKRKAAARKKPAAKRRVRGRR